MPDRSPGDRYSPNPNVLERKAAAYLSRLNEGDGNEWRERSSAETGEMERVTRWAVTIAAILGVVSGAIIGGTEVWIHLGVFGSDIDAVGWREQLPYWVAFFALAGVVSAIEIVLLYATTIRGVAVLSNRSGITLGTGGYPDLFGRGLARAALEFPNPRVLVYGVDPYAYMSGWWIAARNIAYKMKVGVSSFLLRIFLRRVVARMAIRGIVPLIAVPLYALWNAIIIWRIMREARLRMFGPFAVEALVGQLSTEGERPGPDAVEVMMHGVGEIMMRGHDAHPNQVFLLSRLRQELGYEGDTIEVDWEGRRKALASLERGEQQKALGILTLSSVLGSRIYKSQKELLREAHDACGLQFQPEKIAVLRASLWEGRAITQGDFVSVRH